MAVLEKSVYIGDVVQKLLWKDGSAAVPRKKHVIVTSVEGVVNLTLWKQYAFWAA